MKVLFIGGTGIISSACTELCVKNGFDLWLLNRKKTFRPIPDGTKIIKADIRNKEDVKSVLAGQKFDVVVDWVAYNVDHVENDIELFRNNTSQYIFISSASAYQTPPSRLPITESMILDNPFWDYSRNKIACEERLINASEKYGFPVTIVRPSHTYDKSMIPFYGGYTVIDRMRKGKSIIIHGDGTSLWTLTHHRDFAKGFIGLLGNHNTLGESYHITSDEILTWNQIYEILAERAGVKPNIVHIASDFIASFDPKWGESLLGDKTHSKIFDNSRIKKVVPEFCSTIPFSEGAREIIYWYDTDISRRIVDTKINETMDLIVEKYERVLH